MKKAWSVILVIVFGALLCGAICVGVGYITGADLGRISAVLENSAVYSYIQLLLRYWDQAVVTVSQLL